MNKTNQLKLDEYYQLICEDKQLDIRKMKADAEELLSYSYQINDTYGQAFAFLHLSIYYITKGELDSARYHLEKSKTLCIHDEFDKLLASCYCCEGTIYKLNGDKIKAIRIYGKAMDLAEKQNENSIISVLYNNIAVILMDYEDMELAKKYFQLAAEKLMQLPKQKNDLVQVYANLVHVCCVLQDLTAAHDYFNKANIMDFENEKASSSIKASEVRLYAEEHDISRVEQAYVEYMEIINHSKASEAFFASDILIVAESLLIADVKENCRILLTRLEKLLEHSDLELELQLFKLYIRFQETYGEESAETYEKYYFLLIQSEDQEYSSLAESLRSRIKLSEMNQKQSVLEKENEMLQKQAHLDEMTGTFNRRYFDKLLLKINSDSHVQRIGCIMIDIDHFKKYNDTYGHLQGDEILKHVADTLTEHAVEGIYVGRFGGDEFYCLCAGLHDTQIEQYLTDIYDDLHGLSIEHCMNTGHIITMSAGYCNEAKIDIVLSKVLDCADQALYAAKEKGRNCFVKYTNL